MRPSGLICNPLLCSSEIETVRCSYVIHGGRRRSAGSELSSEQDQIFQLDDTIEALRRRGERLRLELTSLVGEELTPALMPAEPDDAWSEEAKQVFAAYRAVQNELTRRNSRRASIQLSRFMKPGRRGEGDRDEGLAWWIDRY